MSLQAMAEVIGRHQNGYADGSPARGSLFVIELMIADAVNDENQNVFWMSNENLARKARVTRQTASRCLTVLEHFYCCDREPHHVVEYRPEGEPNVLRMHVNHASDEPKAGRLRRLDEHHQSGTVRWQWTGDLGVGKSDTPCRQKRHPLSANPTTPVGRSDTNPREPNGTQAAVDYDKQLEQIRAVKASRKR